MKKLLILLDQKWLWILICLIATVFIHIALRYYFWNWSAENYDNIVTPTATVISVALFVWLTWRQSRVIESQNLKQNLQVEFDLLVNEFQKPRYTYNYYSQNMQAHSESFNAITVFDFFMRSETDLQMNSHYTEDKSDYNNGIYKEPGYYMVQRNYSDLIKFLNPFVLHEMIPLNELRAFCEKVSTMALLPSDEEYFKVIIRNKTLSSYFNFMKSCNMAVNQYQIPLINKPNKDGKVEWVSFPKTKIATHYQYFIDYIGE